MTKLEEVAKAFLKRRNEMITVVIYINGNPIFISKARRIEPLVNKDQISTYQTDDGKKIRHKYSDGAQKLAIKMLRGEK